MRKEIDLRLATRLINHGPVILISSLYDDKRDITPVAWHMPISKEPPVIALEIGRNHFIYDCIINTGDFVVNIPSANLAEHIVKCGSCSGRDVDKFKLFGLTPESARSVKSPRLRESLAIMECVMEDARDIEEYDIILGKVKYAEVEEEAFSDHWLFEREDLRTIHHLGNRTFCVPNGNIIDLR